MTLVRPRMASQLPEKATVSSFLQKIKIIMTSTPCWRVEAVRKTSIIVTPPTHYLEWVPLSMTDGKF